MQDNGQNCVVYAVSRFQYCFLRASFGVGPTSPSMLHVLVRCSIAEDLATTTAKRGAAFVPLGELVLDSGLHRVAQCLKVEGQGAKGPILVLHVKQERRWADK